MFFTPELLARRDSGFGLLWLAATLGPKTIFKRIPRRSVIAADISQLCGLIAEPVEPLALRLSSNLMLGVIRVYKVKQEIFLSDVTTCFNSLKKTFQELQSASDEQLQMAQPSIREGALTLTHDPKAGIAMDFDALVADWDEYLNIGARAEEEIEFQSKKRKRLLHDSHLENARANLHTLNESTEQFLSASFDESFLSSGGAWDPPFMLPDGGFSFDDNPFAGDDLDIGGGIGDELARELGEGWGALPLNNEQLTMDADNPVNFGVDMNIDMNGDLDGIPFGEDAFMPLSPGVGTDQGLIELRPHSAGSDKENIPPNAATALDMFNPPTPPSFAQLLISQDNVPDKDPTANERAAQKPSRPPKRAGLILDSRIELTDEELKSARARYLQDQMALRQETEIKRLEKEGNKLIDSMVFGVPTGMQAQVLIDFWSENLKIQIEARAGFFNIGHHAPPPQKRQRKATRAEIVGGLENKEANPMDTAFIYDDGQDLGASFNMDVDMGVGLQGIVSDTGEIHLRSSDEPGQARHASRPPSVLGDNFEAGAGLQDILDNSHRNSLFPWDNVISSSVADALCGEGSDHIAIDRPEIRMRMSSRSGSKRASPLMSHIGSGMDSIGFSPSFGREGSQFNGEDFFFDVPAAADNSFLESERSNVYITLEKNSLNFFEYLKMLIQSLPHPAALTLDDVVPAQSSTRHVAVNAVYHCLVLATKDLLRLNQSEPFGPLTLEII